MASIPLKLSDALYARVKAKAALRETNVSAYIRGLLLDDLGSEPTPAPDPKQSEFKDDPKTLRRCKELWRDKGYKLPFPVLKDVSGKSAKELLQVLESGVDPWWGEQGIEWEAGFACNVLGPRSKYIFPENWLVVPAKLIDGIHSVQGNQQQVYRYWPKSWWAEQVELKRTRYDVANEIWQAIEGGG